MSTASGTHVDVYWDIGQPDDLTEFDQVMTVRKKTASSYWSLYYEMTGAPSDSGTEAGYMGLQTDATRPDGSKGEMAIFSVWNADDSRNQDGTCINFSGEGEGLSCRAAMAVDVSASYRYRVERLESDSTGQWWGAWIENLSTGDEVYLGDLHNASTQLSPDRLINFSEYWGTSVPCDEVPTSEVVWGIPQANPSGDDYAYQAEYDTVYNGECTDSSVTASQLEGLDAVTVAAGPDASTLLPEGDFQIVGLGDKCIGAADGSTENGTAVDLYACTGADTQSWTFPGDGTARVGGKCLDVQDGATADGAPVQLWTCNDSAAQQWVYQNGDLVNPYADKCLDLSGNSSADFTTTQIWTCSGGSNQKWTLTA